MEWDAESRRRAYEEEQAREDAAASVAATLRPATLRDRVAGIAFVFAILIVVGAAVGALATGGEGPRGIPGFLLRFASYILQAIMWLGAAVVFGGGAFCIYMAPWLVSKNRRHHNSTSIGVLNLLLGWTLLGWVIALVWANTQPNAASPSAAAPRHCSRCGAGLLPGSRFCSTCGAVVGA